MIATVAPTVSMRSSDASHRAPGREPLHRRRRGGDRLGVAWVPRWISTSACASTPDQPTEGPVEDVGQTRRQREAAADPVGRLPQLRVSPAVREPPRGVEPCGSTADHEHRSRSGRAAAAPARVPYRGWRRMRARGPGRCSRCTGTSRCRVARRRPDRRRASRAAPDRRAARARERRSRRGAPTAASARSGSSRPTGMTGTSICAFTAAASSPPRRAGAACGRR